MIALNSGDELKGLASIANKIDYTIYGTRFGVPTLLADGQLSDTEAVIYKADTDIKIGSIVFVNTDTVARTLNLKVSQNQKIPRLIMPKDLSLEPSYSLVYEDGTLTVLTDSGKVLSSGASEVVDDTTPQLGGELDAQKHSIDFTLQTGTGVVGTTTIDWKLGNYYEFTFGAGNETLAFTAPSGSGKFTLIIIQDSTGGRTITWPSNVKWEGGSAPTLSTAANAVDMVKLVYDGANYYGFAHLNFS